MKFKSLFFEEDNLVASKPAATPAPVSMQGYSIQQTIPAVQSSSMMAGPDPEIRATLLQSINDKKLPGYDYLKYVATLEEMKPMVPVEDARFKMAFMSAKQFGVDKQKLADTARHYIEVLQEDAKEFQSNLDTTTQQNVTTREHQLADLDAQIKARQDQIAQLNNEIVQANTQRMELAAKIAETKAKLDSKKSAFDVTLQGCVAEIEGNIQKINQYIQ